MRFRRLYFIGGILNLGLGTTSPVDCEEESLSSKPFECFLLAWTVMLYPRHAPAAIDSVDCGGM